MNLFVMLPFIINFSSYSPLSNYVRTVLRRPKQWSDESMFRALDTVKEGIPVNRAAELCVPRSTLRDRVTAFVYRTRYIQSLGHHHILQMLKKQSWITF